jgi:hypothetical protein
MVSHFGDEVVDLAAVITRGERPPEHGPYGILIGNENFQFTPIVIADPVVTGAQILSAAGVHQPVEHLLFQVLADGRLEEINPEETTDLRSSGAERFLVFRSDKTYRINLDDRAFDWGARFISGAALKTLAGVDLSDFDVWEIVVGGKDQLIGNKEFSDLGKPGVERFATKRFSATIIVNARPKEVHRRQLSYWDVVELAFPGSQPAPGTVYTIDYDRGPHANPEGSLVEGQHVKVKEGMTFYVAVSDKS